MTTKLPQQALSLLLAAAVILGGLHGKDLVSLSAATPSVAPEHGDIKTHPGDAHFKVGGELHNHIDKQTLQSLLKVSTADTGSTHAVDNRSLRLLFSHRLVSLKKLRYQLSGTHLCALALLTV